MVFKRQLTRFLMLVCALFIVAAAIQFSIGLGAVEMLERIIVVDSDNVFHVAKQHEIDSTEARVFLDYLTNLSVHAILDRNGKQNSPLLTKLRKQMLLENCDKKMRDFEEKDQEYFTSREVVQSPVFDKDKFRYTFISENVFTSQVNGTLVRNGIFKGRQFTENVKFRLTLTFFRNPYDYTNDRLPYAVVDFKIQTWVGV